MGPPAVETFASNVNARRDRRAAMGDGIPGMIWFATDQSTMAQDGTPAASIDPMAAEDPAFLFVQIFAGDSLFIDGWKCQPFTGVLQGDPSDEIGPSRCRAAGTMESASRARIRRASATRKIGSNAATTHAEQSGR